MDISYKIDGAILKNRILEDSATSAASSKTLMMLLTPAAISTIISSRIPEFQDDFTREVNKEINYALFKKDLSNPLCKEIHNCVTGALDALTKNYLRSMELNIRNKDNDTILESYIIKYKYFGKDIQAAQITSANKLSIYENIVKFFEGLNVIKTYSLPQSDNLSLELVVNLYDDVAPKSYNPPFYGPLTCNRQKKHPEGAEAYFGKINTPFHSLKCFGYGLPIPALPDIIEIIDSEEEKDPNPKSADTNNNLQLEPASMNLNQTISSIGSPQISFERQIECICGLNKQIEGIKVVRCNLCSQIFHSVCLGYLYSQPELDYTCEKCSMTSTTCTTVIMASYRIILGYLYINKQFPKELINQLRVTKFNVLDKFRQCGLIYNQDNEMFFNTIKLYSKEVMSEFFYNE